MAPSPKGFFEAEAGGGGELPRAQGLLAEEASLGPKFKSLQSVEISAGVDRPGYLILSHWLPYSYLTRGGGTYLTARTAPTAPPHPASGTGFLGVVAFLRLKLA